MSNIKDYNEYKSSFKELKGSTSTPNNLAVSGRKPIHCDKSLSPISDNGSPYNTGCRLLSKDRSESHEPNSDGSETSSGEYEESSPKLYNENSSKSHISNRSKSILKQPCNRSASRSVTNEYALQQGLVYGSVCVISVIVGVFFYFIIKSPPVENPKPLTIEELQRRFPDQLRETWHALESGIEEVKSFNKPSVFLLLFEDTATETLHNLLENICNYASYALNENRIIAPIVLTSAELSSGEAKADYGHIIEQYKGRLQENGVMVVKNLDKVPGVLAQAFHSMCDEITPLVERTVYFFTIKIDNLDRSDVKEVEEILRKNWNELRDDIFHPLFTRISSMILKIVAEKT